MDSIRNVRRLPSVVVAPRGVPRDLVIAPVAVTRVVVTVGVTNGLEFVDVNPTGILLQLYVFPRTEAAPTLMDSNSQIDVSEIT